VVEKKWAQCKDRLECSEEVFLLNKSHTENIVMNVVLFFTRESSTSYSHDTKNGAETQYNKKFFPLPYNSVIKGALALNERRVTKGEKIGPLFSFVPLHVKALEKYSP